VTDQSLHAALGLTDDEYATIERILGREPNHLELAMYAVMWSEHCSYKSSRLHLRRLPSEGKDVLVGPGEGAGVVDVGDGIGAAIRIESHNHPSAVEPFEGAATGVGGIVTLLPDMAGLIWIQSRLVFFIAAAYGFDPRDPMRPAELLVLTELYPDVPTARAALDGAGKTIAEAYIGSKLEREEVLAMRLARMLGRRGIRRIAGRLIPFAAIVFNAVANERSTRQLADRAIRFYGG